jgi:hypothetical protein
LGGLLIGLGVAAAGGALFLANSDEVRSPRWRRDFGFEMGREHGSPRGDAAMLLGAAAVISGVAGLAVLLSGSSPDPAAPKVAVGVAPSGVVLSGNFR